MNPVNPVNPQWAQISRTWNTFTTATPKNLFSVQGIVQITALFCEVTEVLAGGSAVQLRFQFDPTTSGSTWDLSTAVSVTNAAVGRMFGLAGNTSGATLNGFSSGGAGTINGLSGMSSPVILKEGIIVLTPSFSGTMTTGKMLFRVRWEPFSGDASVTPQA